MTDSVKEQLSACLDGALPAAELDLLVKRVERDVDLQQSMRRYALISEALRAGRPSCASAAFGMKVMQAVQADHSPARRSWRVSPPMLRWLRPAAGVAIAAGVAAIAVLSLQPPDTQIEIMADNGSVTSSGSAETASYTVPTSTPSTAYVVPATRLTNYVVAHSEYSSPLSRGTVLSSVLSEEELDADEPTVEVSNDAEVTQP